MPRILAKQLFVEGASNVFSHTIQGLRKYAFSKFNITLNINIYKKCIKGEVPAYADNKWITTANGTTLNSTIYIWNEYNRNSIRFVLAHEIYHILEELDIYRKGGSEFKKALVHGHDIGIKRNGDFLEKFKLWRSLLYKPDEYKIFMQRIPRDKEYLKAFNNYLKRENDANIFAHTICHFYWNLCNEKVKKEVAALHNISNLFKTNTLENFEGFLETLESEQNSIRYDKVLKFEDIITE